MEIAIFPVIGIVVLFILFKVLKAFIKWLVIFLILIFAVAYLTNPIESIHHQSLKKSLKDLKLKKVREKFIHVDDYKFFSLTKVEVDGHDKIVGVGAFGKVWYFDDLEKKLQR
ncbi:hypothetical protein [Chryseolinea sp. H1M3-3]|uniref:hypothetical protein n=1 Tax=Chryseolinea sp. H1M3-3 TaxID=3034144 RepID=UPI0023EC2ED5|nr:hypothetical protein [Chryseolinea sp. H1M3-3]